MVVSLPSGLTMLTVVVGVSVCAISGSARTTSPGPTIVGLAGPSLVLCELLALLPLICLQDDNHVTVAILQDLVLFTVT